MPDTLLTRPVPLWTVRLLSLACAAGACLLLWCSTTEHCPSWVMSCCADMLHTKWSRFFGVPVSVPALVVYLAVFALTFPRLQSLAGGKSDQFLFAAGAILICAAIWFISLMAREVSTKDADWCYVCLTLHGIGIVLGGLLLAAGVKASKSGLPGLAAGLWMALAALGSFIAGQVYGPQTVKVSDAGTLSGEIPGTPAAPGGQVSPSARTGRTVTYFQGKITYDSAQLPCLGPLNAPVILVEYFDYTCGSCRDMHGDLTALRKKYPAEIAIISLPTPLLKSCNPFVPATIDQKPHYGACELARWSLTVWHRLPDAFPAFHEFLMSMPRPRSEAESQANVEKARVEAERIAPGSTTAADPWVDKQLEQNFAVYHEMIAGGRIRMPKLLLPPDKRIDGTMVSTETALTELPKMLGLPPRP